MYDVKYWEDLLNRANRVVLQAPDLQYVRDELDPKMLESHWLGLPPATGEEIAALERRLNVTLPPSYRTFLEVSNGWAEWAALIGRLLPASEVDWFRILHADWLEIDLENADDPEEPDMRYFDYGPNQDTSCFLVSHLSATLAVSTITNKVIALLNPKVVLPDGEWEAWSRTMEGVRKHRSFAALLETNLERAERRHFGKRP
jgi:hypothetical protein